MKTKETYESYREQRRGMSLKTRLTLSVGLISLLSIFVSFFVVTLINWLFPFFEKVPKALQFNLFCIFMALVLTRFISRFFFNPIRDLLEGMRRVADGDFKVRLDTKSTSKELREVVAGFNLMVHELDSTEILQSDFVSNVSHEIKTPINAIEGYATLLHGELEQENCREYTEKILFNTRRLSTLVGNILLLSRLENSADRTVSGSFRLDEQIRHSLLAQESAWSEKEIEFEVNLEETVYEGKEGLLHHVWDNLLSNAIKFSPRGGVITLSLKREKNEVVFFVEDCGPGLSEETKKHLFDKFYQGDISHKQEGNGLGLPLVKRVLTLVGGSVEAENLQEGGCRFTVRLPVV